MADIPFTQDPWISVPTEDFWDKLDGMEWDFPVV